MCQSSGVFAQCDFGQHPGDVVELDTPLLSLQQGVLDIEHLEDFECRGGLFGQVVGRIGSQQVKGRSHGLDDFSGDLVAIKRQVVLGDLLAQSDLDQPLPVALADEFDRLFSGRVPPFALGPVGRVERFDGRLDLLVRGAWWRGEPVPGVGLGFAVDGVKFRDDLDQRVFDRASGVRAGHQVDQSLQGLVRATADQSADGFPLEMSCLEVVEDLPGCGESEFEREAGGDLAEVAVEGADSELLQGVDDAGEHFAAAVGGEIGFGDGLGQFAALLFAVGRPGQSDENAIEDLGGGVAGEGDREDLLGRDAVDQPRDVPVGELVSLAGAGRGPDQPAFVDVDAAHGWLQCS